MERYSSALALVLASSPDLPVHCIRPQAAAKAANEFVQKFPGDVLYAVKANPHPTILDALYGAGIRWFDVASMREVEIVASRFADARLAFMHPVKSRSSIRRAYFEYNIRIFAVDSLDELNKIIFETNNALDLHFIVRIAVTSEHAQHKLEGKFGVDGAEAVLLLREARAYAEGLGVSFHVGSQCMRPVAWREAMQHVSKIIRTAGVTVDIVNVGGGFPVEYTNLTPPPLSVYFEEIENAFAEMPVLENADLWCEPGRALCASAGSHIARVELRKRNALYLNEGAYGALFDAAHGSLIYPAQLLRKEDSSERPSIGYHLFGPTCDAIDAMPGPFFLPSDIGEGDYIEFGMTGSYGNVLASKFNGFGEYLEVLCTDKPFELFEADNCTEITLNAVPSIPESQFLNRER